MKSLASYCFRNFLAVPQQAHEAPIPDLGMVYEAPIPDPGTVFEAGRVNVASVPAMVVDEIKSRTVFTLRFGPVFCNAVRCLGLCDTADEVRGLLFWCNKFLQCCMLGGVLQVACNFHHMVPFYCMPKKCLSLPMMLQHKAKLPW